MYVLQLFPFHIEVLFRIGYYRILSVYFQIYAFPGGKMYGNNAHSMKILKHRIQSTSVMVTGN